MCRVIWSIIRFSTDWHRLLHAGELVWHLAAAMILVSAALMMKRSFGSIRPRGDLRVTLAFVPFVNWRSVVPAQYWPIISRVNRRVRVVIVVYAMLALVDIVMLVGVSSCPPSAAHSIIGVQCKSVPSAGFTFELFDDGGGRGRDGPSSC